MLAVAGAVSSWVPKRGTVVPLLDLPFLEERACKVFHSLGLLIRKKLQAPGSCLAAAPPQEKWIRCSGPVFTHLLELKQ